MSAVRTEVEHEARSGAPGGGTGMAPIVTVRYWAGARAAAGVETETAQASTVGELTSALASRRPALEPVLAVASVLVDGLAADASTGLVAGMTVEILPPFAGG